MVERLSPLALALRDGTFGNVPAGKASVSLSEITPVSIAEAAAWPGQKAALAEAIESVTGLPLSAAPNAGAFREDTSAFSIGPERFLVTGEADLAARLAGGITLETGTVTDLSHGRTALQIAGPRSEWVLAKLFAIDFSFTAFPVSEGRATAHHDISAKIQRTGDEQFDIYVFRSFARAFWSILCDAAEEVGYEVTASRAR